MAFLISAFVGLSQLMGSSVSADGMSGGESGVGRFSSSLKCSDHCFSCSLVVVSWFPFLFFTGLSVCWNLPVSFLVTKCRSLRFPGPAAVSVCPARSLLYSLLSFLMLFFTSLSAAVYSSCAFALATLVWLLFSTVFLSLLVSSLWMVSAEIHSLCCLLLAKDLFTCVVPELLAVFPLCFNVRLTVFYQLL